MRVLVLFSRDLRVHDHPALWEASNVADEVVPAFILDDRLIATSANRARFLLETLTDLDGALRRAGGRLVVRRGHAVEAAVALADELTCDAVFTTSDVTRTAVAREAALRDGLGRRGISLRIFPGNAIVEPGVVAPDGGGAYRVFTPYWRAWASAPRRAVLPAPDRVRVPDQVVPGVAPDPAGVRPDAIDLPRGGEAAGRRRLNAYLTNDVTRYASVRDDLAADATSRLSPYLRFGCVSSNEAACRAVAMAGAEEFVRQLCWRDFFRQLLSSDPSLAWRDLRKGPPPTSGPVQASEALAAWGEGRTGVPLVDAGMRQLLREGWMHNRARLVVGSFLTRRLGVPWQEGARVFLRLLVDGDPANNAGGWQWVAGTGADARRSRSFNPVRQARRFDPAGAYVRRYVRELDDAPSDLVFAPWKDRAFLRARGYDEPILSVPDR